MSARELPTYHKWIPWGKEQILCIMFPFFSEQQSLGKQTPGLCWGLLGTASSGEHSSSPSSPITGSAWSCLAEPSSAGPEHRTQGSQSFSQCGWHGHCWIFRGSRSFLLLLLLLRKKEMPSRFLPTKKLKYPFIQMNYIVWICLIYWNLCINWWL